MPIQMIAFAACLLAALAGILGCSSTPTQSKSQPACPAGEHCTYSQPWPPFTAVYEVENPYVQHYGTGQQVQIWETRRITYTDRTHWRIETLESTIPERVGSYEQQDGREFTSYSADVDDLFAYTFENDHSYLEPENGAWSDIAYADYDVQTRADGIRVEVDTDICDGDACHEVESGGVGSAEPEAQAAQQFHDVPLNHIFTADEHAIPLTTGNLVVRRLETRPTKPDPDACQTNLREVFAQATLEDQMFSAACTSTNRAGARAHFYEFRVTHRQNARITTTSSVDDIRLYLLSGSGMSGQVLVQGAPPLKHDLEPGTYTVEVTTANSSGTFGLEVLSLVPPSR